MPEKSLFSTNAWSKMRVELTWVPNWGDKGGATPTEVLLPSETMKDKFGCYAFLCEDKETGEKKYRYTWDLHGDLHGDLR